MTFRNFYYIMYLVEREKLTKKFMSIYIPFMTWENMIFILKEYEFSFSFFVVYDKNGLEFVEL